MLDPHRLVMVWAVVQDVSAGKLVGRVSTGYAVSERWVLTCAHGVKGALADAIKVDFVNWKSSSSQGIQRLVISVERMEIEVHESVDAALLKLAPSPADAMVLDAYLDNQRPVPLESRRCRGREYHSAGFPCAGVYEVDDQPCRDVSEISGTVSTFGGGGADRYELMVDGGATRDVDGWCGVSGAPVFVDGALVGLVRSQLLGFQGRLWATPIKRILTWANPHVRLPVPTSDAVVSLGVHRYGFLQWLGNRGHRQAFIEWFNDSGDDSNLSPSTSKEDIVAAWKQDMNLLRRLNTAEFLADDYLVESTELSKKEARASVFRVLSYLVPLHLQAPSGASRLLIEIAEAQRVGGPIQLIIRSQAVDPKHALSLENVPDALEALQAVTLPDVGVPPLEANDALLPFYTTVAASLNTTPDGARDVLGQGYRRYRDQFALKKRRNRPVDDLERPKYLRVSKDQLAPGILHLLLEDLQGAVYEEERGLARDGIPGALTTTLLTLAKGIDA